VTQREIAAALAANAKAIVSYDRDLLALVKPFGVPIMRPAAFLLWGRAPLSEAVPAAHLR
jgi:predicted nucleic acid-binding protein